MTEVSPLDRMRARHARKLAELSAQIFPQFPLSSPQGEADKLLTDNTFPPFPPFSPSSENRKTSGSWSNEDHDSVAHDRSASSSKNAGAREVHDDEENGGKGGKDCQDNDIPLYFFSPKEEERGKRGKSEPFGLTALAAAVAPRLQFDPDDLRAWFEERAAIREYDGGMSRDEAELAARDDLQDAILRGQIIPTATSQGPVLFR